MYIVYVQIKIAAKLTETEYAYQRKIRKKYLVKQDRLQFEDNLTQFNVLTQIANKSKVAKT